MRMPLYAIEITFSVVGCTLSLYSRLINNIHVKMSITVHVRTTEIACYFFPDVLILLKKVLQLVDPSLSIDI